MAGPTRISQLTDGSPVQATDQVPVARGSGASGYTYKVNAGRLVSDLLNVTNSPSVNLSFDSSTRTLSADVASTVDASVNVVDSPTIDLDWNASTRTLSADASYLLSLINQLSSDMKLEPTSSAVFTGIQTNTVVTNQPAILYSASSSDNIFGYVVGSGYQVIIASGSTEVLRLYPTNYVGGNSGGITSDNPSLPVGGLDCPNGITINATGTTTGQISIGYRLK